MMSAIMRQSAIMQAVKHFFKTTTLHGFKYLYSEYNADRVGWFICCCASACCAGVLCAVLWTRFLEVPALLALRDLHVGSYHRMPLVAVCPPVESVAETFVEHLTTNSSRTKRLPITLSRVLNGRPVVAEQLIMLDHLLGTNNLTLPEALLNYVPSCPEVMRKCRWQNTMVPCDRLFQKELTSWGVCCILRPDKVFNTSSSLSLQLDTTRRLDLAVQCSNGSTVYGCGFFTKYDGEEWVEPNLLEPGYLNVAQLKFTSIRDSHDEKLVDGSCVSGATYSRSQCLAECAETSCGCSDPLQLPTKLNYVPPCSVGRLGCLRAFGFKNNDNVSCHCLPACRKVTSYLSLESSKINIVNYTYDPIYVGLNITRSVIIYLGVNTALSRTLYLNPTENWLTLLSSLGGVFNMFLGVGLFSALEILFLLLIKLPLAIRRSSEMKNTTRMRH